MAMKLIVVLALATSATAFKKSFLGNGMQPEVVARTLSSVEDEWKAQAAVFAECSSGGSDSTSIVNCNDAPSSFAKSCSTVVSAIIQGSGGDKDVAKEYMADVCSQRAISGWHQGQCHTLSSAVQGAMVADKYENREHFNTKKLCTGFWSGFLAEEQTRMAKEKTEREAAEKKAAEEEAKQEAEAKKVAEQKAKEEVERKKAEEAARKKQEAEEQAAEAKAKAAAAAAKAAEMKAEAVRVAEAAKQKMQEAEEAEKEHKAAMAKSATKAVAVPAEVKASPKLAVSEKPATAKAEPVKTAPLATKAAEVKPVVVAAKAAPKVAPAQPTAAKTAAPAAKKA